MSSCRSCSRIVGDPATSDLTFCPECLEKEQNASLRPRIDWRRYGLVVLGVAAAIAAGAVYFYIRGHTGIIGEVRSYADRMCSCRDADCARSVGDEFDAWLTARGDQRVTHLEGADVKEQVERMEDCQLDVLRNE